MSKVNVLLPAMGEGVIEATINKWLVTEGTSVNEEDPIVEVATDKVDSEVPSPAKGTIFKIVSHEGDIAKVGEVIAILETNKEYKPDEPIKVEKEVSRVNELLCMGCGTCVSACPSGAMKGNHFTNEEIFAEIEGVLA